MKKMKERPPVEAVRSSAEFRGWYWPVVELHRFCDRLGIPKAGRKADLRSRVERALEGDFSKPRPAPARKSDFDWSNEALEPHTILTQEVSFGPNFRRFFKENIGKRFVCHSDFMEWVRSNPGKTLQDAVDVWQLMEKRKDDPGFRREIASCNNFLQYLRDFRDANPTLSHYDSKKCWSIKSRLPANNGTVIYEGADLDFIE
ncbi:MAG: DUF6434 domain-containing protein [Thalassobaculaceae bacterium]|uniref:DUF6434 domain-containing protein n=1 Tax=Roseitalea porphyridii TaxID=1852022 RepID=UPI0032F02217